MGDSKQFSEFIPHLLFVECPILNWAGDNVHRNISNIRKHDISGQLRNFIGQLTENTFFIRN